MIDSRSDIIYSPSEAARVRSRTLRRFCRSRWCGLGLVMLCLAVYLPGLAAIPPVDRDESRFAQASRQMYESGDYVVPRVQDRPRLNKPPLIYWLQCAAVGVLGDRPGQYENANIWVFRLPSMLCAIGTVLLTWRLGLRVFDPRAAALGATLLAVCPMVVWDAHQARADQLLLLTTTAAMVGLFAAWQKDGSRWVWVLFWGAMGAGVLAKGPITPLVVGLTAVSLGVTSGRWRWMLGLRPALGLVLTAAIVVPWVVMVGNRVGWSEFLRIVSSETIGRSASPKENHWFPPGFHLVLFSVLFWPGSLLTGLGLVRAFHRAFPPSKAGSRWSRLVSGDGQMRIRFLLCWIVPTWVFFELISTKLPHYVMPLYPAIALLSARAVLAAECGVIHGVRGLGARIGFGIWVGIGAAAMLGLSIVVLYAGRLDAGAPWFDLERGLWFPGCVVVAGLIAAARALQRGQFARAQGWGLAMVVVWGATFLQFILPSAERFWISKRIAALGAGRLINTSSFREDSLIFMQRGGVELRDDAQAAEEVGLKGGGEHRYLVSPESKVLAAGAKVVGDVPGWNYSNGKVVRVLVVEGAGGGKTESE